MTMIRHLEGVLFIFPSSIQELFKILEICSYPLLPVSSFCCALQLMILRLHWCNRTSYILVQKRTMFKTVKFISK